MFKRVIGAAAAVLATAVVIATIGASLATTAAAIIGVSKRKKRFHEANVTNSQD